MKEKQTSLVTKLVNKYKINVQFLDNKNQTLLMLACIHGLHEIIAALLKMGIQQDA
jgi:ankyrin repeat protein